MESISQEDYLRAIYNISEEGEKKSLSSAKLADFLGFSKPAVSKMLKKMSGEGFIKMDPYSSFSFTKKGFLLSQKLTYKHRIIEVFLFNALKVNKKDIHKEAHKLEHAFSDNVIKKMDNFLGNPKESPFGKKIPKI